MARRGVASIQEALVGIDRIANGVVWRSDGAACAVLEVAPLTFDLLPEAEQRAVLAGFGAFLNALTHPIQILVRVARLDLEPYLADLTERARREPAAALADLAHDHVAALRDLAASRLLLDRHFYLVIPDEDLAGPRPPRRFPRPRREGAPAAEEPARRRLAFRCEEAVTRLGRCRLRAWRLDDTALARLYRDCWHQDEPGDRGVRDIATYTGLTAARAGRHAPAHPPAREETPGPLAEPGAADGVAPDVPAHQGRPRRWWRRRPAGRVPTAPEDGRHPDSVRFAEGARAVADYIAPEAVEIDREWLRLNRVYGRTLAVTNLPPALEAGWLQLLTGGDEPLTVSLHVRPLDTTRMIRDLQRRAVQIQSSQLADERAGKLDDPARRIAFEQIEALRDALQRGDERLFSVGLYLFLAAPSPRALDDRTARVEHLLEGALAQSRRATFEQDSGFRACLPLADDRLRRPRNLETGSVGLLIAFCDSCLTMGRGPVYGLTPEGHGLALLDRHGLDLPNGNTFVCAKAGAGKSFFVKVAALRG
ncbi:MAG TPA: hypothetical protein VFL91_09740, partial [Thermomicrobiales bacterium]|nr:hypothetical protein [Thermomicrobiales bacterium]